MCRVTQKQKSRKAGNSVPETGVTKTKESNMKSTSTNLMGVKGKREPVAMLRLNPVERERLDTLVWDAGWTGDLATFVRELVLSKRRTKVKSGGNAMVAVKLDEVLGLLSVILKDVKKEVSDQKRAQIVETHSVLSELAKELYSGR
jgi:hypothetical protein